MVDTMGNDGSAALRIYIEAQDRASAEVRRTLANIRKEEQAYAKDSETLDRQRWNATHTARERDIRDAQEYYGRMRSKYDGDAQMQTRITDAEQAKLDEIESAHVDKSMLKRAKAIKYTLAGTAAYAAVGLAAGAANYQKADDQVKSATTADSAVTAIIKREQAKAELLSFIPFLGDVYAKIVHAVGGAEGWELLKGHIAQAKADFTDLANTATKAVQQASISMATSLRALPVDIQAIKDRAAESDREKATQKATEQRQSTERAFTEAQKQGLTGAPLADLRRQAKEAQQHEDDLRAAYAVEDRAAKIRRQQAVDEEFTTFNRSQRDTQIATIGAPMAANIKAREDSDRKYSEALKPYELLADQRKQLDEKVGADRAAVEQKWAGHIAGLQGQALADAQAARARELEEVDRAHQSDYARLNELEQRKTAIVAAQSAERVRLEQDAATARQRMIEDAAKPITGKEIREVEIRQFTRKQADERKGYENLSQQDQQALDEKQRVEKESFYRGINRQDADAATELRRKQIAVEVELSRSREAARQAELDAVDDQLAKDRERLSFNSELVRQAEREADLRRQAINQRVDQEKGLTVAALQRQAIDAAASNDQTLEAAKARELRGIEADMAQRRATARAEDLAAIQKIEEAQKTALDTKYRRLQVEAENSATATALRTLGMGNVADMVDMQSQFTKARRAATDDPDRIALLNVQQNLVEARMKSSASLPVTRETQSQTSRFGGTLMRRTPGFDDPAMRQSEEVRKAMEELRKVLGRFSNIFSDAEKIGLVKLDSFR